MAEKINKKQPLTCMGVVQAPMQAEKSASIRKSKNQPLQHSQAPGKIHLKWRASSFYYINQINIIQFCSKRIKVVALF